MFKFADIIVLLLQGNWIISQLALLKSVDLIKCATSSPLTENLLTLSAGSTLEAGKEIPFYVFSEGCCQRWLKVNSFCVGT